MSNHYVITITRQFGSLGRPIAGKLSEILGIEYYDRDIVEETAKKLGMPVADVSSEEEIAKSRFFNMSYPLGSGTTETQDKIFAEQANIISSIANKQSCIIVGRCSDFILEDRKNSLHIYIYAPYSARFRNCVDILKMEDDEARKMIARVDKARDNYHRNYAGYLPSDCNHKDVMIDSSQFGIEGTAKILANIARERFQLEKA